MKPTAEVSLFWGSDCIAHRSLGATETLVVGEGRPLCVPGLPAEHTLASWSPGGLRVQPPGGAARVLAPNERAEVTVGAFTFVLHVSQGEALPRPSLARRLEEGAAPSILGSAFAHLALFAALAMLMPTLGSSDTEAIGRDQLDAMAQYLSSAAEREEALSPKDLPPALEPGDGTPERSGRRPKDTPGALANPVDTDAHARRSVAGHDRVSDGKLARERELALAEGFGIVSLLPSTESGHDAGPPSPWGVTLRGADKESHLGNLWGADVGDAFGSGLDLSGTGDGVGGRGRGVQLDGLGLSGTGWGGTCDDTCEGGRLGHGSGTGRGDGRGRRREHDLTAPSLRAEPTVNGAGHLDPRIIARIVRQNHGRFLACYEDALRGNPTLQGRVSVVFVIGRDGAVALARDSASSELPDAGARQCIVKRFLELGFPEPTGGTVHVVYPLVFTPTE